MNGAVENKLSIADRVRKLFKPRSFSRYMVVGGLNTLAGLAGFPILYWLFGSVLHVNALIVINWIINNTIGYLLHKTITFGSKEASFKQIHKFFVLSLISLVANLIVMNLVLYYVKVNPIIVLYGTTFMLAVLFMFINYFGMDKFIFRRGESGDLGDV